MLIALKVILGTLALILFYRSGRWIFDTENKAKQHGLQYTNATGSNYLKGDIGGMLCFGSIMAALMIFQDPRWMFPIVLLLICVAIMRVYGLIVDGYSKMAVFAIAAEIVMAGLAYWHYVLAV